MAWGSPINWYVICHQLGGVRWYFWREIILYLAFLQCFDRNSFYPRISLKFPVQRNILCGRWAEQTTALPQISILARSDADRASHTQLRRL